MTTELVKEATKLAEQELKDEEKMRIKDVVKATLEKLRKKETEKRDIDEEIKILRKDIEDMKEGRIDRIKERQDIDAKAKDVSVIIIKEKIVEKQVPLWYYPWIIEIKREYVSCIPMYSSGAFTTSDVFNSTLALTFTSNNSNMHMYTSGTYQLSDGTIRYI
jgi:alpha-amylase/alpha-mannosidase (GH57 family)